MNLLKKLIPILLILILIVPIFQVVQATTDGAGTIDGTGLTWIYTTEDKTLKIEYSGEGTADIPDFTTSKRPPFDSRRFTKVVIGEGVTSIGNYIFYENRRIESVDIANTVTSIGNYAFKGYAQNSKLTTVTGMEGVETIGNNAFEGTKITELNAPSLLSIGNNSFSTSYSSTSSNQTLVSVNAPLLSTIGDNSFYNQDYLTTFYAPKLTNIGERAFDDSLNLINLTIGELPTIGLYAFRGTPYYEEYQSKYIVNIGKENPEDVKIEYNDFSEQGRVYGNGETKDFTYSSNLRLNTGGYPLSSIVIEEGVTSIGKYTFYTSSTTKPLPIEIGNSVKIIGESALNGINIVTGMQGVEEIGKSVFDSHLISLPETLPLLKVVGETAFRNTKITEFNAPNLETIGKSAFSSSKITSLHLPSLLIVEELAFNNSDLVELNAPILEEVGYEAFRQNNINFSKLTTINAPNIKTIGKEAFYRQGNLTSVNVSEDVEIGLYAFRDTPLHQDYQSTYTANIGKVNLDDVKIEYNDYTGQARVFGNGEMQDFRTLNSQNLLGAYSNNYPITSLKIEEGVTNIGKEAFYYLSNYSLNKLTEVILPSSVDTIGEAAFRLQDKLEKINLENIENIGNNAFRGNSSLNGIDIGNTKIIGENAFEGNSSLNSIDISNATSIGVSAFQNTYKLSTIYNNSQENQIVGNNAFNRAGRDTVDKTVYLYSTNSDFNTQITTTDYQLIYLDNYTPDNTTLEDWLEAGKTVDSWFQEGNTIEDFIERGGTADNWINYYNNFPWLFDNSNPVSSWGQYGGTPSNWVNNGGSPTSWVENGGNLEDLEEDEEEEPLEEGRIDIFVDDSIVYFPDVQPKISNDEILIPIRFVLQELGADVFWDEVEEEAVIRKTENNGRLVEIIMKPYINIMKVNGQDYILDTQVELVEGRLLLPGSEITKALSEIFYKQEVPAENIYQGYYFSEEVEGVESKLENIPELEEFIDNPNLVELTPENELEIFGGLEDSNIILTADPSNFKAILPIKIVVYQGFDGEVLVADNYYIKNENALGMIKITNIGVIEVNGWVLDDIDNNFHNKKINSKEYGLMVNGVKGLDGKIPIESSLSEPIRNGESMLLDIQMKIAPQKDARTVEIAQVVFTVDFY